MTSTNRTASVPKHVITINVEDYFQVGAFKHLIPYSHWERFDTRIKANTEATLALLERYSTKATFFTCGWIADNFPEILQHIINQGHEIACHGYFPQTIRDVAPEVFREDVRRSKAVIEDTTGKAVNGFRIGRGRIGPDDLWALDILIDEGFKYDSSLCPIGREFSAHPEKLKLHQYGEGERCLFELPVSSTAKFGFALPFSGGNYVRQFPAWLIREAVARWVERRQAPLVMYFHIWELDSEQPIINAAHWLQRVRHYRNLKDMPARIAYFLERYRFTTASGYLGIVDDYPLPASTSSVANIEEKVDVQNQASLATSELEIIVPCYNEEASIPYLSRTLDNFESRHQNITTRYIFVDDGSKDGTWERLVEHFGDKPNCKLIQHETNSGIAAAITSGFKEAQSEVIAVIDADCTFDPMQLGEMLPLLTEDVSVVAASPLHHQGSLSNVPSWRLLLSKGAAFLYRCVLNHQLTSYTSCFRLYRRAVVADLRVSNQGFCGVAEMLARIDLGGAKIVEFPAALETRLLGESKINLARTIFDHLNLIYRLALGRWLHIALPEGESVQK